MDSFISSVITLALVMDGFGNIPLFITALKKVAPERRKIVLVRELSIAMLIMVLFLFCGKWFLQAFGIHSYSLSIAGGIILFLISIDLVFGKGASDESPKNDLTGEPFIVPLAIPLVAGPAALSLVLIIAAQHSNKFITASIFSLCNASKRAKLIMHLSYTNQKVLEGVGEREGAGKAFYRKAVFKYDQIQ